MLSSQTISIHVSDWEAQGNRLADTSLCDTAFDMRDNTNRYFELVHHNPLHWVFAVRDNDSVPHNAIDYVSRIRQEDPEDGYALCSFAEHARSIGDFAYAQELFQMGINAKAPDAQCLSGICIFFHVFFNCQ